LDPGELVLDFDEDAQELVVRARTSDGSVHTGTVATLDSVSSEPPLESEDPPMAIPNQSLTIDGDVSELEGVPSITIEDDFTLWNDTDPNLSGTVWFTYDEEYLYMATEFDDETHRQQYDDLRVWREDAIQFGVARGDANITSTFYSHNIALAENGPIVYRTVQPERTELGYSDGAEAEIVHDEQAGTTTYEVALPWEEQITDASAETISLVMGVIDKDDDQRSFHQWGEGMFGTKNAGKFVTVQLGDE
jgi:hypothetical protein